MNSFRIDFVMNRGHEMLIDRMSGIFRHELDELELRMLQAVEHPYLLPVDWQELNGAITFSYKLGGYRMLQHELRPNSLSMLRYYELLLQVMDALDECRHHMLRPDGCLLEDCYIFTNNTEHSSLRFVYMPMKELGAASGTSSLINLIVRWTSYVDVLDGEGLKQIMQTVIGKKWPIAELRDTLLGLIGAQSEGGGRQPAAIMEYEPVSSRLVANTANSPAGSMPHSWGDNEGRLQAGDVQQRSSEYAAKPSAGHLPPRTADVWGERSLIDNDADGPLKSWAKHNSHHVAGYIEGDTRDAANRDDEQENGSRYKWITAALSLVVTACIWRFIYMDDPSNQKLLICVALTLLVAGGMLILWRKKTAALAESVEARFASADFVPDTDNINVRTPIHLSEGKKVGRKPSAIQSMLAMNEAALMSSVFEQSAASESAGQAKAIKAQSAAAPRTVEPTAMLSKEEASVHKGDTTNWFVRSWQGQEEVIKLPDGQTMTIGRAEEQIGYTDRAEGISRLHLELERQPGDKPGEHRYLAKDLGSRNGSFLNGEPMIPYKAYPLAPNDVIHLASLQGSAYTYRVSSPA